MEQTMISVTEIARTTPPEIASTRLLRLREVCRMVGFGKSTIYKYMNDSLRPFPKPLKIGVSSRWAEADIFSWVEMLRTLDEDERRAMPPPLPKSRD